MKVLYDDQIFATQRFGGISRYITEIATRTSAQAEVLVSAGMYLNQYLKTTPQLKRTGFYADVDAAWRVRDGMNQVWTSAVSRTFQPDVVHETYYRVRHLHPRKTKVVVTVHDMIHELYPDEAPYAAFLAHLKQQALKRADTIVCVSETTKNDLLNFYPHLKDAMVAVIPHGHSFRSPSNAAIAQIDAITKGKPFILYVGHRAGYKRFSDVLAAYQIALTKYPNLQLLAFGCGNFSPEEKSQQKEIGLTPDRVLYAEGKDELLCAAYTQAKLFCYPSLYEGFGIPILEALAAGCPVICSDTPIFREVGKNRVLYHKPLDVTSLSELILDTLKSNQRKEVKQEKSDWSTSAEAHARIYKLLTNTPS